MARYKHPRINHFVTAIRQSRKLKHRKTDNQNNHNGWKFRTTNLYIGRRRARWWNMIRITIFTHFVKALSIRRLAEHQLISVCSRRKFIARAGNDRPMKKGGTASRANEKRLSTCSVCGYSGLEHVAIVWCSFVMSVTVRDGQCLLLARNILSALQTGRKVHSATVKGYSGNQEGDSYITKLKSFTSIQKKS